MSPYAWSVLFAFPALIPIQYHVTRSWDRQIRYHLLTLATIQSNFSVLDRRYKSMNKTRGWKRSSAFTFATFYIFMAIVPIRTVWAREEWMTSTPKKILPWNKATQLISDVLNWSSIKGIPPRFNRYAGQPFGIDMVARLGLNELFLKHGTETDERLPWQVHERIWMLSGTLQILEIRSA